MTNKKPKEHSEFNEFIKSLVIAIILAVLFRSFVYEPYHIPTGSMKPTLIVGDNIFVSKFSYGFSRYSLPFGINVIKDRIMQYDKPKRGDIIVFRGPKNNITYIKRLIGMAGEKIQIKEGLLYINDVPVKLEDAGTFTDTDGTTSKRYIEILPNNVKHYVLDKDKHGNLDNTGIYEVPENSYFMMGDNRDQSADSRVENMGYINEQYLVGRAEIIFFSSNSAMWKLWSWFYDLNLDRFFRSLRSNTNS